MRRKLYFGVALATLVIVAGAFILNQTTGAQDAPKKVESEQKKSDQDLFDALRQKFEAKPEPPSKPTPLPLPTAQTIVIPPPMPKQQVPTSPPTQLPPSTVAPASEVGGLPPLPGNGLPPVVTNGESIPGVPNLPGTNGGVQQTGAKPPALIPATPPPGFDSNTTPPPGKPQQWTPNFVTPGDVIPPQANPTPAKEPIKLKGSAWSLHVEMVNGQTVVTATVNKKHEFKIVCQNIDLQTVAGVMKAKGKVQITGDALNGSCDQLTLPLHDDRLLLEGAAEVRIQKTPGNVSATRAAAFELKGDKLDLRISELRTSAYIETSWRKVGGDSGETRTVPAAMRTDDGAMTWTKYGKLRSVKSSDANVWSLEGSDGEIVAYVMARDGGSLEQYVGRTIAVYGAREGERSGHPLVRVTHIAVP